MSDPFLKTPQCPSRSERNSIVRLPEDIFRDLLTAKIIPEKNVKTCSRSPKVFTGTAGRPSQDVDKEPLAALLLDVGFNVGQIAELLEVGKKTIETNCFEK